jgi:large subunit ribosomal protein L31
MKQRIHPDYHPVVFRDRAANYAFLTRSTATSERTITWEDGRSYPVVDVEISSASHPFFTGQTRVLDTAGRVEQFRRRYGNTRVPDRLRQPRNPRDHRPSPFRAPLSERGLAPCWGDGLGAGR